MSASLERPIVTGNTFDFDPARLVSRGPESRVRTPLISGARGRRLPLDPLPTTHGPLRPDPFQIDAQQLLRSGAGLPAGAARPRDPLPRARLPRQRLRGDRGLPGGTPQARLGGGSRQRQPEHVPPPRLAGHDRRVVGRPPGARTHRPRARRQGRPDGQRGGRRPRGPQPGPGRDLRAEALHPRRSRCPGTLAGARPSPGSAPVRPLGLGQHPGGLSLGVWLDSRPGRRRRGNDRPGLPLHRRRPQLLDGNH